MLAILGLIIFVAAAVVGVVGVLANLGGAHALTNGFTVFGYHTPDSTGMLFLSGIVVGAAALLGLALLLAGARRSHAARRDLRQYRREERRPETAPADQGHDEATERGEPAEAGAAGGDRRHGRLHLFGHRAAHR